MSYSQRVFIATGISIVLHVVLLWVGLARVDAIPVAKNEPAPPPLTFQLEPPTPEPEPEPESVRRQIIETPTPTNDEVGETDLISDKDSKAADMSDETGERLAPASEDDADFDQVELRPTPEPELSPVVTPSPEPIPEPETPVDEPEEVAEEASDEETVSMPEETVALEDDPAELVAAEMLESLEPDETEESEEAAEAEPEERFEVAQAPPPPAPAPIVQDIREGQTRKNGGTSESGVLSFEAHEHELGEYMLHVRREVEKQWRAAVQLKYGGIRHAETRIRLSIQPDGQIAEVEILDPGDSLAFAVLSKEAVLKAGPFNALPFDVPEVYRSRNLDITWRFSFN